jgi:hypothetical protein
MKLQGRSLYPCLTIMFSQIVVTSAFFYSCVESRTKLQTNLHIAGCLPFVCIYICIYIYIICAFISMIYIKLISPKNVIFHIFNK